MRVLVIGGSGRTGKLVINELLSRDHQVTTLARNPSTFRDGFSNLTIIQGTPTKATDMNTAFEKASPDIVIVTLAAPRETDSPFAAPISPPRLMADCNHNVVASMQAFGVRKVVVLQAFGVGQSWDNMPCMLKLLMSKSNMSYQYEDHNLAEQEVKASHVDSVFVRPCRLVEGDAGSMKVWPNDGKGVPLMAAATRQSVARWMVDAAESTEWDNSAPVISD